MCSPNVCYYQPWSARTIRHDAVLAVFLYVWCFICSQIRPLWKHYYTNTQAVIFVVDSNDRARIKDAREELHKMMNEDELREAFLLIYANKQDLPNAIPATELSNELGLNQFGNRTWYIQAACATQGTGLYEGMDWLTNALKHK